MSFLGQVRGAVDRVAGRAPGDVEGPALAAQKARSGRITAIRRHSTLQVVSQFEIGRG